MPDAELLYETLDQYDEAGYEIWEPASDVEDREN